MSQAEPVVQAHSHIGASSMKRWAACPGSVRLSKGMPNKSSAYAEEGTKAHEVAATYLTTGKWPTGVDPEMGEAVKLYVEEVLRHVDSMEHTEDGFLIEHRFDLSSVYPGLFGTADAVIYDAEARILRVFDYKHGMGIPVEVEENEQLMYYGLGALLSTGYPCDEVELTIVQPRCPHSAGPIRKWKFPAIELIDFADDLAKFARRTEDSNAPLVPGEHCRFCPAAGVCPKLAEEAQAVAKVEFRNDLSYDPKVLAKTLDMLPVLEGWIKSVREFAYGEAQHGRTPPGWKLVAKRATRRWKDEERVTKALAHMFGNDDDIFEKKIKSPAAVEKLLSNKQEREWLSQFVSAESSGLALAPADDPRPAIKADAKAEFTVIT